MRFWYLVGALVSSALAAAWWVGGLVGLEYDNQAGSAMGPWVTLLMLIAITLALIFGLGYLLPHLMEKQAQKIVEQ